MVERSSRGGMRARVRVRDSQHERITRLMVALDASRNRITDMVLEEGLRLLEQRCARDGIKLK